MNFLFLSNTRFTQTPYTDATTRYRCYNHAEDLTHQGYIADVALADDIDLDTLGRYDVVMYSRPRTGRRLSKILAACRRHRCITIADFDDLVFSPDHAHSSPAVINQQASVHQMTRVFKQHLNAIEQFDATSVATAELARYMSRICPDRKVLLLENGLSRFWLSHGTSELPDPDSNSRVLQYITYLPGGRSHDDDFREIENVIAELLSQNPEFVLRIVGNLNIDESLFSNKQLLQEHWIDYVELPALIKSSFVTIAPLADTRFNRCKSHIKFIESAAFGTPIIASSNPDTARHEVDGLMLADSLDDWGGHFQALLNQDYYDNASNSLFNYARTCCTNGAGIDRLIRFADTLANRSQEQLKCA